VRARPDGGQVVIDDIQGRLAPAAHRRDRVGRPPGEGRGRTCGQRGQRPSSRRTLPAGARAGGRRVRSTRELRGRRQAHQPGWCPVPDRRMVLERVDRGGAGRKRREGADAGADFHRRPDREACRPVRVPEHRAEPGDPGARGEDAARQIQVRVGRDSGREQRFRPELSRQHAPDIRTGRRADRPRHPAGSPGRGLVLDDHQDQGRRAGDGRDVDLGGPGPTSSRNRSASRPGRSGWCGERSS
jgi:hypothetical protein